MWLKWLPWRYLVSRAARSRGFVDPIDLLTRLYRFAEPSEVAAPMELLRAGVEFHARGLINTRAIQHNLDWVWPYWVQRQFNPRDSAFVPRAFSATHINLTCRNWTAVGLPNVDLLPIVDPAGLVTPHWDGWSLDGWVLAEDGRRLLPSQQSQIQQRLDLGDELAVETRTEQDGLQLTARTTVQVDPTGFTCAQTWTATSDSPAWLAVSLRPYNPEGVSFVHQVELEPGDRGWLVDQTSRVEFSVPAQRHRLSDYRNGDVFLGSPQGDQRRAITCNVGMATAAALFALEPGKPRSIEASIPLTAPAAARAGRRWRPRRARATATESNGGPATWAEALSQAARIEVPDPQFTFLYESALRTLVLHTPGEVYPGPYTYKRFWVRDTAFILYALLNVGLIDRTFAALPHLLARQVESGYFLSQEGEWDANGEALWILSQSCRLAGRRVPEAWRSAITKGARWIVRKRVRGDATVLHAGLLPAGFSAEHLGTNDYYYWDDFWAVAGLRAAVEMLDDLGDPQSPTTLRREADDLLAAVQRSLEATASRRSRPGIPASPYRRMDAGAIGSLVAGYPLAILPADDRRLLDTVAFLRETSFVHGGFFQDMIHSGINAYLTLHAAQVLLRADNPEWFDLVEAVAAMASPTGQWPEAIHPHTGGGCMGDGQHVWAAAEWVMALRNAFVREEGERLVLASGIPAEWLEAERPMRFGPTPTRWGKITVFLEPTSTQTVVRWQGQWRKDAPPIEVRLLGQEVRQAVGGSSEVVFESVTSRSVS